jgi:hypothetical protein
MQQARSSTDRRIRQGDESVMLGAKVKRFWIDLRVLAGEDLSEAFARRGSSGEVNDARDTRSPDVRDIGYARG